MTPPDAPVPDTGFDALLGLEITHLSGAEVRARWTLTPDLHQPYGIVHGGAHCAVVETLASRGALAWRDGGGPVVGVANATDFLRAVREGELAAVATPLHQGRSQQLWQVVIRDERDRVVARGQVRLQNLDAPR
ncbi:PaaI family thioesterase [Rhodococcus aerolatus]